jgi:hypothetical protein
MVAAYLLTAMNFPYVMAALGIGMIAAAVVGYLVGLIAEAVRAGGSTARSPLIGHREPLSLPKTQSIRGQQRIRT